jgi:hypothetical protein
VLSQLPTGKNQSATKLNGTRSQATKSGLVTPKELNEMRASLVGIASMRVNAPYDALQEPKIAGVGQPG